MSNTPTAVKVLTITWKIRNFSYAWRDLRSPPVTSPCFNNATFYLQMDHIRTENNKQIRVSITTSDRNPSATHYEVAFLTSDGSPELLKEEAFEFGHRRGGFFNSQKVKETLVVPYKTIFEERRDAFLPHDTLTIRCRLQQREALVSASEEIIIHDSVGVRRMSFIWTLNEVSGLWTDKYASLITMQAYGRLRLKASIKGEHVALEVHRDNGDKIFSTLKVSLLDAQKTETRIVNDTFFFVGSEGPQIWKLPLSLSKKELLESKSKFLPNDALSLKCEFAASVGIVSESEIIASPSEFVSPSNYFNSPGFSQCKSNGKNPSGSLQSDLKSILDTGSLSDFELRVDSDAFPVHKALLGARSPTFSAMFSNDYKETCRGHVLISDINADTIGRFLIYLYTDAVENLTTENATELYFAADKYEVLCLREICASFLKDNVSSSTACDVLVLADRHQDEELKIAVVDYITKNESAIFRSEKWRDLEKNNNSLAIETLREVCLKKSTK